MTSTDSSTTPTTAPTVVGGEIFYDTPLGKQAEHSLEKIEEEVFLQAFAVEGDDEVKVAARIEIELALAEVKSDSVTWTSEFDDNTDIVGTVNEHCERYRRKVDEPLFPSFAFDDRIPNTTKSSFQLPLQVETTGFTIPAKEGHDLTRDLRWEAVRISFPEGTTFYGTGENPGNLALNDLFQYQPNAHARQYDRPKPLQTRKADLKVSHTSTRFNRNRNIVCCWNTDACFYDENFESLYQSHPWVVAVLPDGTSYGMFVDWTYRTVMHFYEAEMGTQNPLQVYFICEAPKSAPPMYLFHGKNVAEIITQLTNLTGRIEMPPYWALGYQQCRYSYFPDNAVRAVADSFREKQIPCDVMWFDIHYMDGYRCFTFDPVHFPNPIDLNAYLHSAGFKTVYMLDPGIKYEKGYSVYDSGVEQDVFIKKNSNTTDDRIGNVWPGKVVFPDFTMERTRKWWASLFPKWISHGVDGTWNDMNEIASFQPGGTIPSNSYHHADEGFGGPDEHARYHNVYGLMMARSTFNGFKQTNPNKRSFVLTRANYMGGHKYAACWTGDNTSDWKHLHFSIPMILNLGLSGQPFTGIDIGGFFYNASPEMYARWVGVGSLLPFARAHSCDDTEPHEPWSFGKETEDSCRRSISRRYRLLPYMYTLFRESTLNGLPVARPLFFADFTDPSLREVDDSFLIGEDLLVRAITIQFEKKNYSPIPSNHKWAVIYLLDDPEEKTDIAHPELRIRQGAILPLGPVVQNTSERLLDPLTLYVYLDQHGHAEGSLYEDAGDGHEHKDGDYTLSKFVAQKEGNQITVTTRVAEGNRTPLTRKVIVKFVGETAPNDNFHEGSDPHAKIVVTV